MIKINLNYFLIIFSFIGILSCYTSSSFFNVKFKKIILPIIFYGITISFLFLLVLTNEIDLLYFSLYLAIIFIIIYIVSSITNFKLLLLSLKSYYIFLLSFTTTFSLYELIFKENIYILTQSKYRFLILFLISIVLYTVFELCLLNSLNLDKLNYLLSSINILIPISMFVLLIGKNYSFFYILNFSKHSILVSTVLFASTLLEIYFGIFMIIAISKAYNLSIYKHKNEILNMQYDLQVNNLKQLEEYQSDIRRISHDIHNHKIIIYNLIKNKNYNKALKYLENFGSGFSNKKYEIFTNHKILNALFLKKKDSCTEYNIQFNLDIAIPENIEIDDFDLCIVVGNLVDNGIEACKKMPASDNKYINIKSKIINNNFIFEMKNNFNTSISMDNEKILTSKKDKLNHGLGLSNVKSTVNKYNGNYNLSFTDNEFTSFVMIPLNN